MISNSDKTERFDPKVFFICVLQLKKTYQHDNIYLRNHSVNDDFYLAIPLLSFQNYD